MDFFFFFSFCFLWIILTVLHQYFTRQTAWSIHLIRTESKVKYVGRKCRREIRKPHPNIRVNFPLEVFNSETHEGNVLPWLSKSHFIKFYHLSWTRSARPTPCLHSQPRAPTPALWAALTWSLREGSTFSFHPLLEDKHQSHLGAHPYSWAIINIW